MELALGWAEYIKKEGAKSIKKPTMIANQINSAIVTGAKKSVLHERVGQRFLFTLSLENRRCVHIPKDRVT